jgi:hypothetical protein
VKEMAVAKKEMTELHIDRLKQGRLTLRMVGTTPLYFNAMSAKAKRDLLLGGAKKTKAQRVEIKHHPEREFRDSMYRKAGGDTLLCFPAPGVKGAMATAALETAGITKSSVQRLIFLPETHVQIWGVPQLKMDIVRSADMNKTPDVRTRAYLPRWCAEVEHCLCAAHAQRTLYRLAVDQRWCDCWHWRLPAGEGQGFLWLLQRDGWRGDIALVGRAHG